MNSLDHWTVTKKVTPELAEQFYETFERKYGFKMGRKSGFSKNLNDMDMLLYTHALISLLYTDFFCSEDESRELVEKDGKEAEASGIIFEEKSLKDLLKMLNY